MFPVLSQAQRWAGCLLGGGLGPIVRPGAARLLGHPRSLTQPELSWSRVVRLQSGQACGSVDSPGNSEEPQESNESLRKKGRRGSDKRQWKSSGQDTGTGRAWCRPSSASDGLCDGKKFTSPLWASLSPSIK